MIEVATLGEPNAQYLLGQAYRDLLFGRDLDKSAYWIAKAAALGHFGAIFELSEFLKYGLVEPNGLELTKKCLKVLKEAGVEHAANELGSLSWWAKVESDSNGQKRPLYRTDQELECEWENSVQAGKSDDRYIWQLYHRHGGLGNGTKAIYYLDRLIGTGHLHAKQLKADCYYKGQFLQQDFAKAVALYKEVAQFNLEHEACERLAEIYLEGVATDKDIKLSLHWFIKAIEKRSCTAAEKIEYLVKNGIFPSEALDRIEPAKLVAYPPVDDQLIDYCGAFTIQSIDGKLVFLTEEESLCTEP